MDWPLATAVMLAPLPRCAMITRGGFGERAVKGGIETGELLRIGEEAPGFADEFEGDGNVERRKVGRGFEFSEDLRRDFLVRGEIRAAVNDAMADGGSSGEIVRAQLSGYQLQGVRLIVDRVGLLV